MAHAHPPYGTRAGLCRQHTATHGPYKTHRGVWGPCGWSGNLRPRPSCDGIGGSRVCRATRVATLYSTRAGLWGQLTVAHGPHSAQLSVWRPCVLVWEPTPATDRTRITMSCQNDRRTQSFLCSFRVGVLKHRVANMCPSVKAVGGTHTCVWH